MEGGGERRRQEVQGFKIGSWKNSGAGVLTLEELT